MAENDYLTENPLRANPITESFNSSANQEFSFVVGKYDNEYKARIDLNGDRMFDDTTEPRLNQAEIGEALQSMENDGSAGSPLYQAYSSALDVVNAGNNGLRHPLLNKKSPGKHGP